MTARVNTARVLIGAGATGGSDVDRFLTLRRTASSVSGGKGRGERRSPRADIGLWKDVSIRNQRGSTLPSM